MKDETLKKLKEKVNEIIEASAHEIEDKKKREYCATFQISELPIYICENMSNNENQYFEYYITNKAFNGFIITTIDGFIKLKNADLGGASVQTLEEFIESLGSEDYLVIDFKDKSIIDNICVIDNNFKIKKALVENHPNIMCALEKLVNNRLNAQDDVEYLVDMQMSYRERYEKYLIPAMNEANTNFNIDDVVSIDVKHDINGIMATEDDTLFEHQHYFVLKDGTKKHILTEREVLTNNYGSNLFEGHAWHIDINMLTTKDKLKLMLIALKRISKSSYIYWNEKAYDYQKGDLSNQMHIFKYLNEDVSDPVFSNYYNMFKDVLNVRTDADEYIKLNKLLKEIESYIGEKPPIVYLDDNKNVIQFPSGKI